MRDRKGQERERKGAISRKNQRVKQIYNVCRKPQ